MSLRTSYPPRRTGGPGFDITMAARAPLILSRGRHDGATRWRAVAQGQDAPIAARGSVGRVRRRHRATSDRRSAVGRRAPGRLGPWTPSDWNADAARAI